MLKIAQKTEIVSKNSDSQVPQWHSKSFDKRFGNVFTVYCHFENSPLPVAT